MDGLPVLIHQLRSGIEGAFPFQRLVFRLLQEDGRRRGYRYERCYTPGSDYCGVDGRVLNHPDYDGPVGYQSKLIGGDLRGTHAADIRRSLQSATRRFPGMRHWVLVIPGNPGPADLRWLKEQLCSEAAAGSVTVHFTGDEELIPLLEQVPALFARVYPGYAARIAPDLTDTQDLDSFIREYRQAVADQIASEPLRGVPSRGFGRPADDPTGREGEDIQDGFQVPEFVCGGGGEGVARTLDELLQMHQQDECGLHGVDNGRGQSEQTPGGPYGESCRSAPRFLITGGLGSGKTALLRSVARLHAGGNQWRGYAPGSTVPLLVSLRGYVTSELPEDSDLVDYLVTQAHRSCLRGARRWMFEAKLLLGEAFLLLDGLDQVDSRRRQEVVTYIRGLARTYPDCPIWVTTRRSQEEANPLGDDVFSEWTLRPFDMVNRDRFVSAIYLRRTGDYTSDGQGDELDSFKDILQRWPALTELADVPLFLSLMLEHRVHGPVSDASLLDFFERLIKELLQDAERVAACSREPQRDMVAGGRLSANDQLRALEATAHGILERTAIVADDAAWRATLPLHLLGAVLRDAGSFCTREYACLSDALEAFGWALRSQGELLVQECTAGQHVVRFRHRAVQEFLAAYHLVRNEHRDDGSLADLITDRAADRAWATVLVLLLLLHQHTFAEDDQRRYGLAGQLVHRAIRDRETLVRQGRPASDARWQQLQAVWQLLFRARREGVGLLQHDEALIYAALGMSSAVGRLIAYWQADMRVCELPSVDDCPYRPSAATGTAAAPQSPAPLMSQHSSADSGP